MKFTVKFFILALLIIGCGFLSLPARAAEDYGNYGVCSATDGFENQIFYTWNNYCLGITDTMFDKLSLANVCVRKTKDTGPYYEHEVEKHVANCHQHINNTKGCLLEAQKVSVYNDSYARLCLYTKAVKTIKKSVPSGQPYAFNLTPLKDYKSYNCVYCKGLQVNFDESAKQIKFDWQGTQNLTGQIVEVPVLVVASKPQIGDNNPPPKETSFLIVFVVQPEAVNKTYTEKTVSEATFDASVLNKLGTVDVKIYLGRIIKAVMGILGSTSLVMFVYSGILFMTDRGAGENVGKAKEIAVWTSLGLVLIFASYAILNFIFQIFGK